MALTAMSEFNDIETIDIDERRIGSDVDPKKEHVSGIFSFVRMKRMPVWAALFPQERKWARHSLW